MKRILLIGFAVIAGFTQAQVKKKNQTTQKLKTEKKWVNPVKLTKEERSRPYMDEVLKTKDSLTPKEAERRRKNIAIGNPFAKYGVYPKIATLSKGKYLEFHDTDSIVVIGSVRFNTKRNNIIEVREVDLSDPDAQPIGDTHGRWMSPDPLSEEFSDWTPYNYAFNNPLKFTDPTGMAPETDFIDIFSGKKTHIEDGKDQTIAATTHEINKAKSNFDNNKTAYFKDLAKKENSEANLNLTSKEFDFLAQTLYAESTGGFQETWGILDVLKNRASNEGNNLMDQLSDESPYGVYGVRKTDSGSQSGYKYSYSNETGPDADLKRNNVHKAIAYGIISKADITNGGTHWDGVDFKSGGGHRARYLQGYLFTNPSHDLFGQGNYKANGAYKFQSTNAIGNTTFSKYINPGKRWYISK
ncbi:cell well associated RhsD protein [Chryseobacterium sp. RU33C]|uniref:cell well associated RhsD protein n=1 Tax=Chryseobacterium sp. RU33C TaxID=1907398 RepID=UPI00161CA4EA|nr:cell well associated RhsD protein [Chryseobacterium sp. RU33C]